MRRGIIDPAVPMQPFAPIEKSEWERLLERLGLRDDAEALREMSVGGVAGAQLRSWVMQMAYRRFVPIKVLESVGLTISVEIRFPME